MEDRRPVQGVILFSAPTGFMIPQTSASISPVHPHPREKGLYDKRANTNTSRLQDNINENEYCITIVYYVDKPRHPWVRQTW